MINWFRSNEKANEVFLNAIATVHPVPEECLRLATTMINEHEHWLNRICSVNDQPNLFSSDADLKNRNAYLHDITYMFLNSASYGHDLNWMFTYINGEKKAEQSRLIDAYWKILMHSQYQRGRIAQLLKDSNIHLEYAYVSLEEGVQTANVES